MRITSVRVGVVVLALVALAAAFLAGQATGQQKKYRTLPDEFSDPYVPTVLEWRLMEYNSFYAWIRAGYDRLSTRGGPVLFRHATETLWCAVDTEPQPSLSQGKPGFLALPDREQRADWRKISDGILANLRMVLDPTSAAAGAESAVKDQKVEMAFYILGGGPFAKFKNGEILLPGEKGFD